MPYSVPLIPTFPLVPLPSFLLSLILSEFVLLKVWVFFHEPREFKMPQGRKQCLRFAVLSD